MNSENKNITKANTALNNKTGSWRTKKPITDFDKCIGCSMCAKLCPDACITMKKTKKGLKPVTNYDYCKGCALCAKECPVKAIKMEKEY
jgi:2-oxoacid:acceptor oxidoreductase delta subunit (pyruvate/2-ketoisovalerate family)